MRAAVINAVDAIQNKYKRAEPRAEALRLCAGRFACAACCGTDMTYSCRVPCDSMEQKRRTGGGTGEAAGC